jgi:chromosome segregation ATPase
MSENRDDEQRQRQIDFIVESLARLTATVERVAAAQEGHEQRITQAERRDDEASERIARFERSYVAISDLLVRHEVQIEAVTNDGNATNAAVSNLIVTVDRLGVIVERYITARGNGSNGTGGGV